MTNEITISTNESDIRSMLIKLMGRGMTLSQSIKGQYTLNLDDLMDLVNKIAQRVQLQNHCKMSDFKADFKFEDGSGETVPSFEALQRYRSVNSNICTSAVLSFAFLIDLHGRGIEKQSIDISITNGGSGKGKFFRSFLSDSWAEKSVGKLEIHIEYTDVTWANDIKNLFEKYADVHVQKYELRSKVAGILDFRLLLIAAMPVSFIASIFISPYRQFKLKIDKEIGGRLNEISAMDLINQVNEKVNILIFRENEIVDYNVLFLPIIVFVCVVAVFVLSSAIARNIPVSAIVLSGEARKIYDRSESKRGKSNVMAAGGIILSLVLSVLGANVDRLLAAYLN